MFKVMLFARRRADLTREQFIEAFEKTFVPIVDAAQRDGTVPTLLEYRRSYMLPDDPQSIRAGELDFDIITENWFACREDFLRNREAHADPAIRDELYAKIGSVLDLSSMRYAVVEERIGFDNEKA